MGEWISVLTEPEKTLKDEKAKASFNGMLSNIIKVGLIFGLIMGLTYSIIARDMGVVIWVFSQWLGPAMMVGSGAVVISLLVATPVVLLIMFLLNQLITWMTSKILGGKGSLTEQAYLSSIVVAGVFMLFVFLIGLGVLMQYYMHAAASTFLPFMFLFSALYGLYLGTLALKETHDLDTSTVVLMLVLSLILGQVPYML